MNQNELRGKIVAKGYTIESFCNKTGFVRATFDRRLSGKSEFDRGEMEIIIKALDLTHEETMNIFFADCVA